MHKDCQNSFSICTVMVIWIIPHFMRSFYMNDELFSNYEVCVQNEALNWTVKTSKTSDKEQQCVKMCCVELNSYSTLSLMRLKLDELERCRRKSIKIPSVSKSNDSRI